MKRKIIFLVCLLLLTTGCTCQYNVTIDNNVYKEQVILTGEDSNEITSFNNEWQIPIDKDEYILSLGSDGNYEPTGDVYTYQLSGSNLTFSYNFTKSEYPNSSAVSNCYNLLTVSDYSESIVISSSKKALCFDKYSNLNSLIVNITVDKPVTSNNADSVNGNTYTWKIDRTNYNNKSINLIYDNTQTEQDKSSASTENIPDKRSSEDYTLYIFAGILLIVMLTGYFMFNKMKEKNNEMDD